jgi:hypothetical protein
MKQIPSQRGRRHQKVKKSMNAQEENLKAFKLSVQFQNKAVKERAYCHGWDYSRTATA